MTSATFILQFRSDLFEIDPQEDEETNPFCYGKALAEWIRRKFEDLGYAPEPIIPEDWGWCVVLARAPFTLWIGCGNDRSAFYSTVTPEQKSSFVPNGRDITWSCLVGTNVPPWTGFFWKRLLGRASTHQYAETVARQLHGILTREPRIQISD